jgi:hypothetical protein
MIRAAIFGPAIPEPQGDPAQLLQISTEMNSHPAEQEEEEESGPGQGWSAPASMESLRVAFEYRGDVTLLLDDDSRVDGYLSNLSDEAVRLWCRGETDQLEIPIRHIKHVELTGRDTASGKSWQTWMKKQEAAQAAAAEAAASV